MIFLVTSGDKYDFVYVYPGKKWSCLQEVLQSIHDVDKKSEKIISKNSDKTKFSKMMFFQNHVYIEKYMDKSGRQPQIKSEVFHPKQRLIMSRRHELGLIEIWKTSSIFV